MSVCVSVCLCVCVCVSVSLCVCLAAHGVRISAPAAPKLHTRTKNFLGKVLKQCRSARLIEKLSEGPVFVAAMASSTTART